jgi:hypothetical protein
MQIGRKCFCKLILQSRQPLSRAANTCLVPKSDKGIVKGLVECNEVDESAKLDCFCGIVVQGREVDSGVQGQRTVTLDGICSAKITLVMPQVSFIM